MTELDGIIIVSEHTGQRAIFIQRETVGTRASVARIAYDVCMSVSLSSNDSFANSQKVGQIKKKKRGKEEEENKGKATELKLQCGGKHFMVGCLSKP